MAITAMPISGADFWTKAPPSATAYQDSDLIYAVLDASKALMKIVLRTATELFTTTVDRERLARNLAVVINGNFFDIARSDYYKAYATPSFINLLFPASATTPNGLLIDNSRTIGGRSSPDMFYAALMQGPTTGYQFDQGDPTTAGMRSAIGGLGPLIIKGLKYGNGNQYRPGTTGPATGPPPAGAAANLTQRNNKTYIAAARFPDTGGKVVIAYNSARARILVVVHPDGAKPGISLDALRDKLAGVGVDNAVFLDGGSSVLLNVGGAWHARPATYKDRTNTIGVGFTT